MENWKKCRFDFQTCLHPNQDYPESVKDISLEKIRHLENSILHNRPDPKLALLPKGGHKKIPEKMCKTFARHCRAASVLSTQSCFSSFEKQYQVFNGLDGVKVPLLVCTNHITNEKHAHHGFLAPRPYLCSTSLSA